MAAPIRVAFVFASRGIGGAERSMLRLIAHAHPHVFECRVIQRGPENGLLRAAVAALGVRFDRIDALDALGWRRVLQSERPDVLYLFGRFRTVAWALEARLLGLRCIVAAERSAASLRSDRLARRLDRLCVSAYIANSACAARNLRAIVGDDGPPVWVAPNGITAGDGPQRRDTARVPSLLCVGNILPNKGQGVLLEAVRLLRARHPSLRATLVGHDFTDGRFLQDAERRGLADTYDAVGFVDDVEPYLARATVLVLPTLQREGMPTCLLEAMRAGVPVVATRVGGVSEIVQDGTTGVLVEPGDAAALADAIGQLLDDAPARGRLAAAGRAYVAAHHDMASMVEAHRTAFGDALARAYGAAPPLTGPVRVAHLTTADISLRYLLLGQLRALHERGYDVTGISSAGPDVATLESHGIRHIAVPITRRMTPLADLRALWDLYRVMRRERFTIVHTHTPKPGLLGQLAARLAGVPVVVNTLHGLYFHERMHPLGRRFFITLEKIAALCSDVILSVNEEDVQTAIREGIAPPDRLRLLGNGIDLRRFDPARLTPGTRHKTRAALGIDPAAPVVGFVGRLVAEKGVRELLQAARTIRDAFPAARVLLIGGTDAEKADGLTPEAARALGLESMCLFAGVRQDMPELYQAMDVFVLPSYREGLPRAAMEACAMGLPCVVTAIRGCRQVVTEGRNGTLVPVGDAAALARAIVALLRDPERRRRFGEESRARAVREFDERRVFAIVISEYDRLLREQAHPRPGLARRLLKTALDRTAAALGLLLLLPLLAVVGLATWATLGRPIFFRQRRPGLHGVPFDLIKFRTMRDGAGSDAERLTWLGRLLRATSVDELPELLNVLRGEMSLVGPRPLLMQYLDRYTPEQRRRHDVRPGITGWAQVNGRNALSWEKRFAHDLWYVDHWSLALDLRILARTVWTVIGRRGIAARGSATMPEFRGAADAGRAAWEKPA